MDFDERTELIDEVDEWNRYENEDGKGEGNNESQGTTHYTPD